MVRSSCPVAIVLLIGCGRVLGFDDYALGDAGTDARADASSDSGVDAAVDAPLIDAGVDTAFDGGPDAGTSRITQVALGSEHTCAMTPTQIFCWGSNRVGQLGSGSIGIGSTSPRAVEVDRTSFGASAQLVAGHENTCIVDSGGIAWCWGEASDGELGAGPVEPSLAPVPVVGVVATQLTIGEDSMCAITTAGECESEAICWGNNGSGRLGRGTSDDERRDPACVAPRGGLSMVDGRHEHFCALQNQTPWCWGLNHLRQVRNDPSAMVMVPNAAIGDAAAPTDITALAAGRGFNCVLNTVDEVRCWGGGGQGQLGDGAATARGTYPVDPIDFSPAAEPVAIVQVAAGDAHACARDLMGGMHCWGQDDGGRLGVGPTTANLHTPMPLDLPPVRSIVLGAAHSCAITTTDELYCWGDNVDGRVGNGTVTVVRTPVRIDIPIE